jgi:hypothetical protein
VYVLHRFHARRVIQVLAAALLAGAVVPSPGAAAGKGVKCVGSGDFCGAGVSIAGGASDRVVTINLTGTNFKRIAVRVIPSASKGAFSITKASFLTGGSQYRFTLNAVKSNPKGARIILLFAAGTGA